MALAGAVVVVFAVAALGLIAVAIVMPPCPESRKSTVPGYTEAAFLATSGLFLKVAHVKRDLHVVDRLPHLR